MHEASFQNEIELSIQYLKSDVALNSLNDDAYWPKWDSPWWNMLLLHEMGETKKIPETTVHKYVEKLKQISLKIFPIYPGEMPIDIDPYRGTPCHCQLGNVYQVLAAWGVNVDSELPWIRPWFLRYQMPDGGLNCDNNAYLVKDEVPSSMVGTIAVFEAILLYTLRDWTVEEKIFLDKAAHFLIKRKLMLGSDTKYNASERASAKKWVNLCFPRFYLYDVLRGLYALLMWSEKTQNIVDYDSIKSVVKVLNEKFPNGDVRPQRYSYEGVGTILKSTSGDWIKAHSATSFPLLERVSQLNTISPFLSKQWVSCQNILQRRMNDFK